MSFYTYYGKLKDELFVAVLPNGTVELEDQVHLYFQKRLITYRVQDVDVTDDAEDRFALQDGYYNFEAVTSKAYKEIKLTRTCRSGGEVATVALTRHYDQVQTASPTSRPKIWTGTIDFHEWAKNESFVVIAPQGLGNSKPVVAIWQWSKDNKGVAKTLSYGVSKQVSEAETPAKFSFTQNEYYTLDCQVVAATKGLTVTVKGPTNAAKAQKELELAPYTEGAEHRFTPPRSRQEKISLECSLPNAKPALPRINAALPFPADLVETLSYSAAYVDQAGYLAKYAVKQFEKLDRSYHLLEKKAEARVAKVAKLEGDVAGLTTDNHSLAERNKDLEAKMDKERKEVAKAKADLQEDLRKVQAALKASQDREKELEQEKAQLEEYIDKDKLADIERERKHRKHEEAHSRHEEQHRKHEAEDHKAIDLAHASLRKAEELARKLKEDLDCKDETIRALEMALTALRQKVKTLEADVSRLNGALTSEKKEKAEIQRQLEDWKHKLSIAEEGLKHLRSELKKAQDDLAEEKKCSAYLIKQHEDDISEHKKKVSGLEAQIDELKTEASKQEKKYELLRAAKKELKEALDKAENVREAAEDELAEYKKKQKLVPDSQLQTDFKNLQARYEELRKHESERHHKSGVTAAVVEITSS
ncbi:hypothetical protein HBI12_156770 [Parastagonospora nodorum]|nr:hypothetical protein HBI12_156770 [Parastagonospora nodorum]